MEFFVSPSLSEAVFRVAQQHPSISFYAVGSDGTEVVASGSGRDKDGDGDPSEGETESTSLKGAAAGKGVTALTWGVFPNKEILQPTIFDHDTFLVWSKEGARLFMCVCTVRVSVVIKMMFIQHSNCGSRGRPCTRTRPRALHCYTRYSVRNLGGFILAYQHAQMHDTYYLVAMLDNDFVNSTLLSVFDEAITSRDKEESIEADANLVI